MALSGGMDSMSLLDVLCHLSAELSISLHVAHLDHQFRGEESAADAKFVSKIANQYGLLSTIESENVPEKVGKMSGSIQEVARRLRYAFFERVAAAVGANKIATAHHANDQAETVLMRFLRGTGLRGLAGIPAQRGKFIRPMLHITRTEIEKYVQTKNISYRIDSSNLKLDYYRNRIRHQLIPFLQENGNPQLISTLRSTAEICRSEEAYLNHLSQKAFTECIIKREDRKICIDLDHFLSYDVAIQRRIIRYTLEQLKARMQAISFGHIEKCIELAKEKKTGSQIHLPDGIMVIRQNDSFVFYFSTGEVTDISGSYTLKVPGESNTENYRIDIQIFPRKLLQEDYAKKYPTKAFFDWDKIQRISVAQSHYPNFYLRKRLAGDRFQPLGMTRAKKLKSFFIDGKIPRMARDSIPLVVVENKILWIVGYAIADWAKIQPETQKVLKIEIKQNQKVRSSP